MDRNNIGSFPNEWQATSAVADIEEKSKRMCGNMEDLLDRTFWRQFGANWRQFGAKLAVFWRQLALIGAKNLALRFWRQLAPNWRCFGAKLAPIWRQLAPIGGSWRSVGAKFWRQLAPTPIGAKNFFRSSRFYLTARQFGDFRVYVHKQVQRQLAPIGAKRFRYVIVGSIFQIPSPQRG